MAWARGPQWNGSPGPDDSYIGGAVSTTDLGNMQPGSTSLCKNSQGNNSTDGCVIRFRFRLPANMPATPCPPVNGTAPCSLTNNPLAQVRYMSLTFWYQTAPPATSE